MPKSIILSEVNYSACPICNSEAIVKLGEAKDHTVSNEIFPIWKCNNCSAAFTQSVPGPDAIGKYYQSESYISHSNTRKGLVSQLYQSVRNFTVNQKRGWIEQVTGKSPKRLLDIGCGTGEFLAGMKSANWQVQGLEPDAGARSQAIEKGLQVTDTENLFALEKGSFEVITLWHVLEHVHLLHEYLDQIRELLVPGGWLLIAVPNHTSLDAEHYGFDWAAWDVPRHLYHFSPASMHQLLRSHGFKITKERGLPFDPFYVSMLSEKYSHSKVRYIPAFWQGFRSWQLGERQPAKASSVLYFASRG